MWLTVVQSLYLSPHKLRPKSNLGNFFALNFHIEMTVECPQEQKLERISLKKVSVA